MARKATMTDMKKAFVDAFVASGGDAAAAVRIAGYQGNDNVLRVAAQKLMKDPLVLEAIQSYAAHDPNVWDKTALQRFWTRVASGVLFPQPSEEGGVALAPAPMKERLRAAELLGKSQAVFVEVKRHEHSGKVVLRQVVIPDNGRHTLVAGADEAATEKKTPLPS
jgi:hypothetical protein